MSEFAETVSGILKVIYYWIENMILFFVPLKFKAKDITGELVLVTGSGSGLGRNIAIKFAENGCNVVLWDINAKGNSETAAMVREKGSLAYTYEVDVTNSEAVYSAAEQVKKDAGIVTIVINNAGIVVGKPILNLEDTMIRKVFDVNVLSHFWIIKAFLPDMLKMIVDIW
ncbi:hypothetical protein CEXT_83181 [Caerostris extrusa]|uniref:Uncharacterized protein n=1 Tax=Caerostris extrusa TaxID=172846 RepID=A0AAV4SGE1_CAEEX|nr:hypothetical protein CEXT_83181 [Caerostris extrusa]